jgi:hypothetical protein
MTRVTNEAAEMEGGMQKVTPEYFIDKGFEEAELRQIAQLEVNQLWMSPGRGCDRSVRRVA